MATPSAAPNPSTDPKPASPVNVTQAPSAPEHFLQRIKLFSGLSVLECTEVVKRMKRRDFPPNTVIVREGAPGNSMFFITAGLVEVRKKDGPSVIILNQSFETVVSQSYPDECIKCYLTQEWPLLLFFPGRSISLARSIGQTS